MRVLEEMESTGIRIDREFLDEMRHDLAQQCELLVAKIHAAAGEEFNVNSTPQLRRILFEKLGLTPVKRTKTGPSTDADSLQKLADEHPMVADLLRYREVEKLRNTYADALPPLIGPDGRIHATLNQVATTTGRISSESPNLQNIPVRTAEGREMRQGVHRRRRLRPAHRRLLADRAARPGPPRRRSRAHRRVRAGRRRPHDHRGGRLRRRRGRRRRVPAPVREGRELRTRVRHGGLRARPAPRHPDRSGPRDPRQLLRVVPRGARLHGPHGEGGTRPRLHDHAVRSSPPDRRARVRQLPHPPDGGADGAERAGAGIGGRHLQARDDRRRRRAPRPRPARRA